MNDIAIRVENLSKLYHIGQRESAYKTLRESIMNLFSRRDGKPDTFWALKDVSFQVKRGEAVGIIGRNGAGKTTLLKILTRITEPTEGIAEIHGRVGSLLEVGTGFHPELTGRENIFLNGAILGMTKNEIKRKFDEIVAFAEIEKFMDTPVKRYSSGMYVRLAFAVAAHLEPEILLVDEVLAVGDVGFQKKCLGKMGDVAKEGRTVLFVSHNMGAIRGLCQRTVWINDGHILDDGETQRVVSRYMNAVTKGFAQGRAKDNEQVIIEQIVFRNCRGEETLNFAFGDDLLVEIHFRARQSIRKPHFWIAIAGRSGSLFGASMLFDGHCPDHIEGKAVITCVFKSIPLLPQLYTVSMGVRAEDGMTLLTETKEVGFFNVVGRMKDIGLTGELADVLSWNSMPMVIPYEWHLPDGRAVSVEMNRSYKKAQGGLVEENKDIPLKR